MHWHISISFFSKNKKKEENVARCLGFTATLLFDNACFSVCETKLVKDKLAQFIHTNWLPCSHELVSKL